MAAVLGPIAAATAAGSIVRRSGSTSAKTGLAPGHHDRERRERGRHRRGDHLVAATDVECRQQQEERVGTVSDADGVRDARDLGKLPLERFAFRSEDEPAAFEHTADGRQGRVEVGAVGRPQVEERHAAGAHAGSVAPVSSPT